MNRLRYRFWILLGRYDPDPQRGLRWVHRAVNVLIEDPTI